MSEPKPFRSLNDAASLWSHIGGTSSSSDPIRKYRRTACPVEGDDDVDDFEDRPEPEDSGENMPPVEENTQQTPQQKAIPGAMKPH